MTGILGFGRKTEVRRAGTVERVACIAELLQVENRNKYTMELRERERVRERGCNGVNDSERRENAFLHRESVPPNPYYCWIFLIFYFSFSVSEY